MNRYHSYNGRFAGEPFRSTIEDDDQTITFCGVGYHQQNSIVKMKVQTLKLGDRTFLLHSKIYCPETISTMLWPYALKSFSEKLNVLKGDDDGINNIEIVFGTTIYNTI